VTRTVVEPLPHDLAVAAALATLDHPVGYAAPPPGALEAVRADPNDGSKVYLVIWPAPEGARDGSVADPYADATLLYTIWVVGGRPDLVQTVQGQLEAALADVEVPGRAVLSVELDLGGITADTDTVPTIFSASPVARIATTPA
jgi:hypothetical protein